MFDLPEKLTIWNVLTSDGSGIKTYSRKVIDGRTALKQEKFTDKNGDQQVSKAVCYAEDEEFKKDSIVYFGESLDAYPVSEADDVRGWSATPSFTDMKKGWL